MMNRIFQKLLKLFNFDDPLYIVMQSRDYDTSAENEPKIGQILAILKRPNPSILKG